MPAHTPLESGAIFLGCSRSRVSWTDVPSNRAPSVFVDDAVMSMSVFNNVRTDWLGTNSVCGKVCPVTGLFRDTSNHRDIAERS
mmetsp:Transcript_109827/g.212643  ORF Transcript_109827/g.212643 Transcript_109827/m.212643 type:complete len:84 (-) Transcript_109827:717-968(-)